MKLEFYMNKLAIRITGCFLMAFFMVITACTQVEASSGTSTVEETGTQIIITTDNYIVDITKEGFRYSLVQGSGNLIAEKHQDSGILIGKMGTTPLPISNTQYIGQVGNIVKMGVSTENGGYAEVSMTLYDTYYKMSIVPDGDSFYEGGTDRNYRTVATNPALFVSDTSVSTNHYKIEVDSIIHNTKPVYGAGLVFGYEDSNNFYNYRVYEDGVQILIFDNGQVDRVNESYTVDSEDRLWVEINGNIITGYVNDQVAMTYNADESVAGKVGYRAYQSTVILDDYQVTDVTTQEVIINEDFEESSSIAGQFDTVSGSWLTDEQGGYVIEARTRGVGADHEAPVYGLGDHGGFNANANLFGYTNNNITNDGGSKRFISTFVIFPRERFAQVLFESKSKRVAFTNDKNMLGINDADDVSAMYYFFGEPETIYSAYKQVRNQEGYYDGKPHYSMFGIGFEAYGALHWNADEVGVENYISNYLDRGYNLTWGVIGSGFWKGERKVKSEGCTTSFGIWDDTYQAGRIDGLANPRFPERNGAVNQSDIKSFFADNNLTFLLGLRNGFKASSSDGGYYSIVNDGNFMNEGLDAGYYLLDDNGDPLKVTALFPKGNIYLLDGSNEAGVEWYKDGVDLWGVDGFKEDAMIKVHENNDANWIGINKKLVTSESTDEKEYKMIIRNSAYSLPGDILRIEDTSQNDPDRIVINCASYAASGQGNVYPDIIGANYSPPISNPYNNYFTRNGIAAALMPSLSVGRGAWDMNSDVHEDGLLHALSWHSTYAPYIFSAAMESYETGYPKSFTPLYIAYPDDATTYNMINKTNEMFEWLLGDSILAAPLFNKKTAANYYGTPATSRDIYLPDGTWMDYESGQVYEGPTLLEDYALPLSKVPAFIGGKGILVSEDWDDGDRTDVDELYGEIYSMSPAGTIYDFTYPDGESTSTFTTAHEGWNTETLVVTDVTTGVSVPYTVDPIRNNVKFLIVEGHDYTLTGGQGSIQPSAVIVDNSDSGYSEDGNGWENSALLGYNNSNSRYCYATSNVGSTARWTPELTADGDYHVYAWFPAYNNSASNAKYTIYYDGGSEDVYVDQSQGGGSWQLLTTKHFIAGSNGSVLLTVTEHTGEQSNVRADAVMFEPVSE